MKPLRLIGMVALVTVTITVSGCGSDDPGAPPAAQSRASSAGSGSPGGTSASPTASPTPDVVEFTVDGAGPYLLGATLDELRSILDEVGPGVAPCTQNTTARGTGTWKDVHLSFRPDGALYLMTNRSPSIPTPSGAWLGTSLAELKKIYVNVSGQDLAKGSHRGFLVTTLSGRRILFELDARMTVAAMYASDASYLRDAFTAGAFC